jgi:predicted dehydrogenase
MNTRRGALLGCGAIAREHVFAMQMSGQMDVVAVCDLSSARAEMIAERYSIPAWFTSHREMLEKTSADFVHITTPPQSHFALAKDCLEAGFSVICEKPITSTLAELSELQAIAESRNLILIENQNYRTHSSVQKLKTLLDAGELGELIEVQVAVQMNIHGKASIYDDPNVPHFSAKMRGGVAGDFLTHMTYIAQIFLGTGAEANVFWNTFNPASRLGQDEFRARLKGHRTSAYLSFSGNTQPAGFWLKLIGTKACAEANLFEAPRVVLRLPRGGGPLATFKDGLAEARSIRRGTFGSLYRKFSGEARYDGLQAYLEQCYDALDDRSKLPVTAQELASTSRLVEQFCDAGQPR